MNASDYIFAFTSPVALVAFRVMGRDPVTATFQFERETRFLHVLSDLGDLRSEMKPLELASPGDLVEPPRSRP